MTEKLSAYDEYLICKRRGHQPSNYRTASIPPKDQCKWCGAYYWTETPTRRESCVPRPPEGVA